MATWATTTGVPLAGIALAAAARGWLPIEVARHLDGVLYRGRELAAILGLATIVMLMGLADDRWALGWKPRLAVQVGLAGLLVMSGVRVTLFGPFTAPAFGGIVTVLWVVGLTNAFNFLDNMDGLAAGVGAIAASLFVGVQIAAGSLFVPGVLLGLIGALLGFLVHNLRAARLYMGDAGSNFLGFLLGASTVAGTYYRYGEGQSRLGVLAPLLVMAVPLYDTCSVVVIRLREGRSPFRSRSAALFPPIGRLRLDADAGGSDDSSHDPVRRTGALLLHRLGAVGGIVVVAQTLSLLGVVATLELSASRRFDQERGVGDGEAAITKP